MSKTTPWWWIYREVWTSGSICYQHQNWFIRKWLVPKIARSRNSTVYSLQGSLNSLEYLAPAGVSRSNFGRLPGIFITGKSRLPSDKYTRESRLYCGDYTVGLDSQVANTAGSWLPMQVTPRIFDKNRNPIQACPVGPGEVVWWEKTKTKYFMTLFLLIYWLQVSSVLLELRIKHRFDLGLNHCPINALQRYGRTNI